MTSLLLQSICLLFAIPVLVLFFQVSCSLKKGRSAYSPPSQKKLSFTVLIPAHNEEEVIAETLLSIKDQIAEKDRIVVIADNCSDKTEQIATDLGVEVISRTDKNNLGKGYAMGFGIEYLRNLEIKPDVLVIMDADCIVRKGEIRMLAEKSAEFNRPVQAMYLMRAGEQPDLGQRISEFAWLVKNKVRPLGYKNMNLPCQLMGTGMAFPWIIVDSCKFSSGSIVEDLELGINYALEGHPPLFYPEVIIDSHFATDSEAQGSQRKRWEHGHLATILNLAPRLIKASIARRDKNCAALAVDLMIPPLALLSISLFVLSIICLAYAAIGSGIIPLILSTCIVLVFCAEILMAWYFFGRKRLGLDHLLYIPVYIVKKVPMYWEFVMKRQVKWVKTSRRNISDRVD